MARSRSKLTKQPNDVAPHGYDTLLVDISHVIEEARYAVARSVNAVMTTTYGSSAGASPSKSNNARPVPPMESRC